MSHPVVLTHEAAADFDAAADWYQQQAGLGNEFTSHIRDALNHIGQAPRTHRVIHRDIRRVNVKRFPYCIYFRETPKRVEVIAILHARRDPSIWKNRS
jgi:toxin ParE1/3/4